MTVHCNNSNWAFSPISFPMFTDHETPNKQPQKCRTAEQNRRLKTTIHTWKRRADRDPSTSAKQALNALQAKVPANEISVACLKSDIGKMAEKKAASSLGKETEGERLLGFHADMNREWVGGEEWLRRQRQMRNDCEWGHLHLLLLSSPTYVIQTWGR